MLKLFQNIWLKIISLVLGLLLWIHVATEKVYNHEFTLPLREVTLKDNLTLSENPPDSISVLVAASGKHLMRVKWQHRGLRINATTANVGQNEITLTPLNTTLINAEGISLDEVLFPNNISLNVDNLVEQEMKVVPDLICLPDDGYTVKRISQPDPATVLVSGPQSLLNRLNQISTEKKELRNIRTGLSITLPLLLPKGYGISVSPDSILLNLEVVPVKTRVFDNVPIVVYNSPPNQSVTTQPAIVRVELTGPPEEIDALTPNNIIASINYIIMPTTRKTAIIVDCPANFKVRRVIPDSTLVIVQ